VNGTSLRLPGETHLGFRKMSKPHLVTFKLMTKHFDIGETSKLCETSKLRRFVLTNQNVLISIVPFVSSVSLVLNLRFLRSRCVPCLESSFPSFPRSKCITHYHVIISQHLLRHFFNHINLFHLIFFLSYFLF